MTKMFDVEPFWNVSAKDVYSVESYLLKHFLHKFGFGQFQNIRKRTSEKILFQKDLTILKKLKNYNTFTQLSKKESVNKKSNVTKKIDNIPLLITKRIDDRQPQRSKKIVISKKVKKWAGIQVIKALFGIPTISIR